MFEELNNDVKIIKKYFLDKNIGLAVDAFYQSDDALDSVKGAKDVACVFNDSVKSSKYENILCKNPLDAIEDKSADCVILRNASYKIGKPKEFIKTCSSKLNNNGYFVLCATIVDSEDAFLNTVKFSQDRNHVRFYTVKEVMDFTSDYFRLEFFKNIEYVVSLKTWVGNENQDLSNIRKDLDKFPENIKKDLNFVYGVSGDLLGFTLKTGLFIFRLLP